MENEVSLRSRLLTFFEPHNIMILIFRLIVHKMFYQFLRLKKNYTIQFINEIFLKLLVLTQVSMGVIIITSVRPTNKV